MPDYAPIGIVKLGHVPFDNSYVHTYIRNWASQSEQASDFANRMTLSNNTYTYVRLNNSIRVDINAELLYGINYCMYQNANYGNKWFYSFVTQVNYINENCTELVLELDVLETFWFELNLKECYVKREHVADDTYGKHLCTEPAFPRDYQYHNFNPVRMEPVYIVFQTTSYPNYPTEEIGNDLSLGDKAMGAVAVQGGYFQRMYSAAALVIYKIGDPDSMAQLKKDLLSMNKVGMAEALSDAYTLPAGCIDENDLIPYKPYGEINPSVPGVWTLRENIMPEETILPVTLPTQFETFIPKNNKSLTYPYYYIEIGDFTGRCSEYKYEFFKTDEHGNRFFVNSMVANGDCQGYITPNYYEGIDTETNSDVCANPFTYDYTNKIPWTYNTFQNWMAQNAIGNAIAIAGSAFGLGIGINEELEIAAQRKENEDEDGESKAPAHARHGNRLEEISMRGATSRTHHAGDMTLRAVGEAMSRNSSLAGGLFGLAAVGANIARQRVVPNQARGNSAGNARFQNGYSGFYYSEKRLIPEFAKIVDDYFTCYGYEVDTLKVPEIFSRPNWNFVRCMNADHHGNIPQEFLSQINIIFDGGITFWHTWDIGNYSLNNQPA